MKLEQVAQDATCFSLGVALATATALPREVLWLFLALTVLALLWWSYYRTKLFLMTFVCLLLFTLGSARGFIVPHDAPDIFQTHAEAYVGSVVADPDIRETNQHVVIEIRNGTTTAKVLATLPLFPHLSYGDVLTVSGTIEKPTAFVTVGGREFPYDKYVQKDGVYYVMKNASTLSVEASTELSAQFLKSLFAIKSSFLMALPQAFVEPYASLAGGLILGAKAGLGKELMNVFNQTGLSHIVVLSGFNIVIVATFFIALFSWIPERKRVYIIAPVIILFVVMAGAGSASVRAGLMALIALLGRTFHKTYDALRALIIVALVMIVWSPYTLLYDPGFQLSVLATLGLLLFTPPIESRMQFVKMKWLRELLASCVAAYVAVLPLIIYYTGFLSFVAIVANVLVLPVVPIAMLVSFIVGLVWFVVPPLAVAFSIIMTPVLWYIVAVAEFFHSLPFVGVQLPFVPLWLVALMYALMAFGYTKLINKKTL